MQLYSVWEQTPEPPKDVVRRLASGLNVSWVTAHLLAARGHTDVDAARAFLRPTLAAAHDAFLLPDMEKAVGRLARALDAGETVAIYGDYDVDGQTSTALLVRGLRELGSEPLWYIPERVAEGYGLNEAALAELAERGATLLITVDCGISAVAEVARAAELGMDVIVTDHHEPDDVLPEAAAIINPKRADSEYPFRELAGVGVAWKLLQALWQHVGRADEPPYALELVALGTVADVCPLVDENRALVSHGLRRMNEAPMPGLEALMQVADVKRGHVTAGRIGFGLAPRLNAAGRIQHAAMGVELLLADDVESATPLAERLDAENRERRRIEADILEEALAVIEEDDLLAHWVLVVAGEGWHPGVIGIVASRLVERFARPAIVIGLDGDEGKGSGRSIAAFDLFQSLQGAGDLLERFGGHQMAAGLTVHRDDVDELRTRLSEIARDVLGPADLVPRTRIDAQLGLSDVNEQLAREMELLAPFGVGNATPVLAVPRALVVGARTVGREGDHLKLTLRCPDTDAVHEAIGFGGGSLLDVTVPGLEVQVAFTARLGQWRGRTQTELLLRAVQSPLAGAEMEAALAHDDRAEVSVPGLLAHGGGPVPVIDRRGRAVARDLGRAAYMATLAAAGARIVAAVGVGEDPEALARAADVALHGGARVASGWPGPDDRGAIVLPGAISDLSSLDGGFFGDTGPSRVEPERWDGRGHLVVFGLPATEGAWAAMLRQAALSPGWTIHLAFAEETVRQSEQYLERTYPGKESLRWVYRGLRASSAADGGLPPVGTLVRRVEQRWPGLVNEAGLRHALAVFKELGLVREGDGERLYMRHEPGLKVDVAASVRYNNTIQVKQLFATYSRRCLTASPAELLTAALERSSLDGFTPAHSGSA